jgi:adenosylcobinamide-GDP ribazoletransferase
MQFIFRFFRHYLLAIQFFTRIPVTGRLAAWVGYSPEMLRASAAHFPGVGALVGALVAMLTVVLLVFLPQTSPLSPLVAAVLGTVFSVMLTGAFHEDGLADIADGLGGTTGGFENRERVLEIMKDSRVGAFGAIAVVLVLLAKVTLLAVIGEVDVEAMVVGIFLAHVASRTFPLLLIRLLPHVGDLAGSKSKPLADQISVSRLVVAVIWLFLAIAAVFIAYDAIDLIVIVLLPMVAASVAFVYMWRLFAKRLQGFTGDCLGATQQVCEVAFYLGMALSQFPLNLPGQT